MESLDQEIERNKQMAREYYRKSNLFTLLCCFSGIPLFLIGYFENNSKAKKCWKRIRELEAQKEQTTGTQTSYCHSCGHEIKEVLQFCPLCGEKIKPIEQTTPIKMYYLNEEIPTKEEMALSLMKAKKRMILAVISAGIAIILVILAIFVLEWLIIPLPFLSIASLLLSATINRKTPASEKLRKISLAISFIAWISSIITWIYIIYFVM